MNCFMVLMDKFEQIQESIFVVLMDLVIIRAVVDLLSAAAAALVGIRIHLKRHDSVSSAFEGKSKRALIFRNE